MRKEHGNDQNHQKRGKYHPRNGTHSTEKSGNFPSDIDGRVDGDDSRNRLGERDHIQQLLAGQDLFAVDKGLLDHRKHCQSAADDKGGDFGECPEEEPEAVEIIFT